MIRVLLAEDQGMVLGALAALLDLEPDLEVVAQVSSGADVVEAVHSAYPDVALLDIEMPEVGGLEVADRLRRAAPGCRPVILTTFGRPGYLQRAMDSGAAGFLVKDSPAYRLAHAIRRVVAGERVVDPDLAVATVGAGANPLSARERDVLVAARDGATVEDIARSLFLSAGTVRNYLSSAMQKVAARNRIEAVRTAEDRGWL